MMDSLIFDDNAHYTPAMQAKATEFMALANPLFDDMLAWLAEHDASRLDHRLLYDELVDKLRTEWLFRSESYLIRKEIEREGGE